MRIKQGYISDSLRKLGLRLLKKYRLREYDHLDLTLRRKPCLFFGCYTRRDVKKVCEHRGFRILIWTGGDLARIKNKTHRPVLQCKEIIHVALSKCAARDLRRAGLRFTHLPICVVDLDAFHSTPLGKAVYTYGVYSDPEVYGGELVTEVQRRLPEVSFLVGDYDEDYAPTFLPEQMSDVYANCFIGLRLTTHDGLSNTVVELGLMGRKCVWNGTAPNAVPWQSVDDVVTAIQRESVRVYEENVELAARVRAFLDIGTDWLTPAYYRK